MFRHRSRLLSSSRVLQVLVEDGENRSTRSSHVSPIGVKCGRKRGFLNSQRWMLAVLRVPWLSRSGAHPTPRGTSRRYEVKNLQDSTGRWRCWHWTRTSPVLTASAANRMPSRSERSRAFAAGSGLAALSSRMLSKISVTTAPQTSSTRPAHWALDLVTRRCIS